jgi:ABC-type bacteriocin/lantibiotic exporter with double-glycine peptidase domain
MAQNKNSQQHELILDILHGESEIRVYQQQSAFLERFNKQGMEYCNAQIRALWTRDSVWSTLDRFSRIMNVIPLLIGAVFICYQVAGITLGVLVAFIQVIFYCSRYITSLAYLSVRSLSIIPSIDRINELLDAYPKREVPAVIIEQTPDSGAIEFRDVSFTYPSGIRIFSHLDLTIRTGEKVAIMAPSGYGKTTFARLLLGLSQPDSGTILFGGKDIRSFPHHFFLSFFSYVSQNSHIFRLSVRDNIEMGWHITDDLAFNTLLENLHIRDFINALPSRADTVLNTEGFSLSKGQQQRIALARALIREPQVLIVDEFTSGLDRITEEQILDDLLSIMNDQTIICITHSPQVAARMDRTIMLQVISYEPGERRIHV